MSEYTRVLNTSSGDYNIIYATTFNSDFYVSVDTKLSELSGIINGSSLSPRYKINILNADEKIKYTIPLEDIASGNYSENYQNGQRRSLSFVLINESGEYTPTINGLWANSKISFDIGLELNDETILWFKKGVYVLTSIAPSCSSDGAKTVSVECADKFNILEGKMGTLDMTYEIPVGSDISELLSDILSVSRGNGYSLDTQPILIHSSLKGKTTQATISKSAGDTYGSIIEDIANQISAEYFYNTTGNLVLIPTTNTIADIDKPVIFDLFAENGDMDNLSFSFNMGDIVNRIVVVGSSNNGSVYKAVAVNNNVESPLCYQNIGYRTGEIINDSNITSDMLAQERADFELRNKLILESSSSINVSFNPLLTVNNLITISDEFLQLSKVKFLIKSISFDLNYANNMSISICNIANLSFLTQ